jgi:hypothetical protein
MTPPHPCPSRVPLNSPPPHPTPPPRCPQTVLILLVWALAFPSYEGAAPADAGQQAASSSGAASGATPSSSTSSSAGVEGGGAGAQYVYNIVLDAGSTGSRVHVFKFERAKGKGAAALKLISDTFEQLKPGLSSYRDDPEAAALSLKPLLQTALHAVPKEQQAATGLSLKATAGLRLLPGSKADDILKVRRAWGRLEAHPSGRGPSGAGAPARGKPAAMRPEHSLACRGVAVAATGGQQGAAGWRGGSWCRSSSGRRVPAHRPVAGADMAPCSCRPPPVRVARPCGRSCRPILSRWRTTAWASWTVRTWEVG